MFYVLQPLCDLFFGHHVLLVFFYFKKNSCFTTVQSESGQHLHFLQQKSHKHHKRGILYSVHIKGAHLTTA